jgi:uncharacterized protein (TIGR00251 family)
MRTRATAGRLGGGLRLPAEPPPTTGLRGPSPRSNRTAPPASSQLLQVRVQPKSRRNEIVEQPDGVFRVRVTAAPADGEANRAVIALLAEAFGVAPSRIALVRGATSRDKLFRIERRPLTLPSPQRGEGLRK